MTVSIIKIGYFRVAVDHTNVSIEEFRQRQEIFQQNHWHLFGVEEDTRSLEYSAIAL